MSRHDGESLAQEIERYRRTYRLPDELYSEHPPFPTRLMVEVTNACNHRCCFCANTQMQRPFAFLSACLYARLIAEAVELGVTEVDLYSTGEPLLHPRFPELLSLTAEAGIPWISTTTNGVLLNEKMARICIEAGIRAIRISINAGDTESYRRVHGRDHFDRVIANVAIASRLRQELGRPLRLTVSCVVSRHSEDHADLLRERLAALVDEIVFMPVGPQSGLMIEVSRLLQPRRFLARHPQTKPSLPAEYVPCAYPFSRVHLTAEGFLTLCPVDFDGKLRCGDVSDRSLREAWSAPAFAALRRRHLADQLAGLQCATCVHAARGAS